MSVTPVRTALITGASSGIGEAFARRLAAGGSDLLLVARRAERLDALAETLRLRFAVRVEICVEDLSDAAGVRRVERRIHELPTLDLLVNNAGFGLPGRFVETPVERSLEMVQLHLHAALRLCHAALPGMIAQGRGGLINVASIGAFLPRPGDATYCATKAFLSAFSQALQGELAGSGVRVQVLCPGFTRTGFYDDPRYTGYDIERSVPAFLWMQPEAVVAHSLRDLARHRVLSVPGFWNRLLLALARLGGTGALLRILERRLPDRQPGPPQEPLRSASGEVQPRGVR
jgi:short-subunit dehydrogenase